MTAARRTFLLLALLAITACTRGMQVGSPTPAETYSINVDNQTGTAMIVSYDDGRGAALLGNVRAGTTERFVIAAPASTTITVSGSAASGSRTSGPYTVTLVAGEVRTVLLR